MADQTPIQEYDRLIRNLDRGLLTEHEHHHQTIQMIAHFGQRDLVDHICDAIPDFTRDSFREFVTELYNNDCYYTARRCLEDCRTDNQLHDDAIKDQRVLTSLIPVLIERI